MTFLEWIPAAVMAVFAVVLALLFGVLVMMLLDELLYPRH